MLKDEFELKNFEKIVLKTLLESGEFLSTREIAGKAEISWSTADRWLKNLDKRGWIVHKKIGNRDYWRGYK